MSSSDSQADSLPLAYGEAVLNATIRSVAEDFQVEEVLGFEPEGEGEHVMLWVEKRGANTAWVGQQLAEHAGVDPRRALTWAGLKDRHAVTRQWFGLHLARTALPEQWPEHAEYRVLRAVRHRRKLQIGALKGNRFRLRLRQLQGERSAIEQRLQQIAEGGVPNYFGEQRFGRDGSNVEQARALFAGSRMPRHKASILLSAVRSSGFNQVLAARVNAGCWNRPIDGEVFVLDGSRSTFGPEPLNEELERRVKELDIHPSGPLLGKGALRSEGRAAGFDVQHGLDDDLLNGLIRAGLKQERRALRLPVRELGWEFLSDGALQLEFFLPAGCYATSVLHELGLTEDPNRAIS